MKKKLWLVLLRTDNEVVNVFESILAEHLVRTLVKSMVLLVPNPDGAYAMIHEQPYSKDFGAQTLDMTQL